MNRESSPSGRRAASCAFLVPFAALLLLAAPGRAGAQACVPPPNEDCAGATVFTYAELPLSHAGLLGCTNDMVDRPYFDVWFRYDCTVSGNYRFDMCGSTGDTYMRLYTDGCGFGPASSWIEDDDGCGFAPVLDPLIETWLQAGTSYWIELGAWREDDFFPPNANDPYEFHVEYLGGFWTDLGGGTVGSHGAPTLTGDGTLVGGSTATLDLVNAPPLAPMLLWLSVTSFPQPFWGGVVHPMPATVEIPLVADAGGGLMLAGPWPDGLPPGTCVWLQYVMGDTSVVWGVTLSNGLKATTP
jgi:hypothetical protein